MFGDDARGREMIRMAVMATMVMMAMVMKMRLFRGGGPSEG
jgi:hypothetical protein